MIWNDGMPRKLTTFDEFFQSCQPVHNGKYEYDKDSYVKMRVKMRIICPIHGDFWQTPSEHKKGKGCPTCGGSKKLTAAENEAQSRVVHGDKYEYINSTFKNTKSKMLIVCPIHGDFWQTPADHKQGKGCPKCGGTQALNADQVISVSKEVHNNTYDYMSDTISTNHVKMGIVCKIHGVFWQTPANHKAGHGCPKCANNQRMEPNEHIAVCRKVHGNYYSYHPETIDGDDSLCTITCPIHGDFKQLLTNHKQGHGCPSCGHVGPSNGEMELVSMIRDLGNFDIITHDRKILHGKELDVFIPSHNLAIEYCGLYYHSDTCGKDNNYHKDKFDMCRKKGIHLITLFEDEWKHRDKVMATIKALLGISEHGVYARKCTVKKINHTIASNFYHINHIQNGVTAPLHYGLFYGDELVSAMSFGHPQRQSKYDWELKRFATNGKNNVGAAGKLLKAFQREHNYPSIVSFSDRRWFSGNMYKKIGFDHDGVIPPDYYYVKGNIRHHKSAFRKSQIKAKYPDTYDGRLTEREMMRMLKFHRIYDCGKDRWVIKNAY